MSEYKMHDMGEMRDSGECCPTVAGDSKKEKHYPTTYLSSKQLPGIEKYDIGDTCRIEAVKKVVGKREKQDGDVEVEVEIREMGIMGKGSVSEDDYKKMSEEDKDKADEKDVLDK